MTSTRSGVSTTDDLLSVADAAALLKVPTAVVRLLVEAHALSVHHPRAVAGEPSRRLVYRREIERGRDRDVEAALANGLALVQYLYQRAPVHRRDNAKPLHAPLWVQLQGGVKGVAVQAASVPVWTIAHGERKHVCTTQGVAALMEPWEARRLVMLASADREARPLPPGAPTRRADGSSRRAERQVSFHSHICPTWLATDVAHLFDRPLGQCDE